MKNEIRVIALLLFLTTPAALAQKTLDKHDKKFRHELAIDIRGMRIPVGEWRDSKTLYHPMPEYSIKYLDKYGLKIGLLGWAKRFIEWPYEKRPFYVGEVVERDYVYWDILLFYTFKLYKRHCLNLGAGYTARKGQELFVAAVFSSDVIFDGYGVNDKGVVGELSYTYDISKRFIAGADIAYRAYNRGDPVITAGVKFGIVLRH